jgi:hypothetical protein
VTEERKIRLSIYIISNIVWLYFLPPAMWKHCSAVAHVHAGFKVRTLTMAIVL